mgnify:CR=1 FL=1
MISTFFIHLIRLIQKMRRNSLNMASKCRGGYPVQVLNRKTWIPFTGYIIIYSTKFTKSSFLLKPLNDNRSESNRDHYPGCPTLWFWATLGYLYIVVAHFHFWHEQTESGVRSRIRYIGWNQDWAWMDLKNSSLYSVVLKGMCWSAAERLIRAHFPNSLTTETLRSYRKWHREYGGNSYTCISDPWRWIGPGILSRVLHIYYVTCPCRIGCSFHPYTALVSQILQQQNWSKWSKSSINW